MGNPVMIDVNDVFKSFRVYYDKGSMLKERFVNPRRSRYVEREVLKGVSFKVKKGETVAIIGQNGCGKSTTLKLLTKILYPNKGTVNVNGKVSSLIELGAGFHPDMSGRENIYINASILGIKRKEVEKRIDEIIRFSELEQFIDNPIRTYSSGMYMRLAFSIAINVDADILLIDEILAVGDQAFQEKCRKLNDLRKSGVTVVLVSHSMIQIKEIADRCIWIENGKVVMDGDTQSVCNQYENAMTIRREERDEEEEEQRKENQQHIEDIRQNKSDAGKKPYSYNWQVGEPYGGKLSGVLAMALFMMFTACQSGYDYIYYIYGQLSILMRQAVYIFFICGATIISMLYILLGFELLGRDYSSREKITEYYWKTFLPVFVIWQILVAFFQINRTVMFLILMMLIAPFAARILQNLSTRILNLLLTTLWIVAFLFPGFDKYGQANGGKASFPFFLGTACCFIYFCIGYMISRYRQRKMKKSWELVLLISVFLLTIWSQVFLDKNGVDYLMDPTYYGISIMAIMCFDLLVRAKKETN